MHVYSIKAATNVAEAWSTAASQLADLAEFRIASYPKSKDIELATDAANEAVKLADLATEAANLAASDNPDGLGREEAARAAQSAVKAQEKASAAVAKVATAKANVRN